MGLGSYLLHMSRWLGIGLTLVLATACNSHDSMESKTCPACVSNGGCAQVSGDEAQQLVRDGALLLDVRTPEEFAADHIDGALNIPLAELESQLDRLDRERPIVVYCRSGNRSGQARQLLCDRGYSVHDLGPRTAWR